jgi:hypothetical protein
MRFLRIFTDKIFINFARLRPTVMSDDTTQNDSSTVSEFLADHPKMTGVLFTMLLLLTQAGAVAAGGGAYHGP